MNSTQHILIAGGGIGGLTLALTLHWNRVHAKLFIARCPCRVDKLAHPPMTFYMGTMVDAQAYPPYIYWLFPNKNR